jgi:hypothetical protein
MVGAGHGRVQAVGDEQRVLNHGPREPQLTAHAVDAVGKVLKEQQVQEGQQILMVNSMIRGTLNG